MRNKMRNARGKLMMLDAELTIHIIKGFYHSRGQRKAEKDIEIIYKKYPELRQSKLVREDLK